MTTVDAAHDPLYVHEIGLYGSDAEFRSLIQPFALGGLEAGEPVVFAYDDHKVSLLREWLPASSAITYITDTGPYATPAKALRAWRDLVQDRLADGAPRVRIAGNVPHEGYGVPYAGWDRYEAAVDRALGDLPVWAPCLYDRRLAPPEVVDEATRLHHSLLGVDGAHTANQHYSGAPQLADFRPPTPDPIEATEPSVVLRDPTPGDARRALRSLVTSGLGGALDPGEVDGLLLGTSEAVANALLHGTGPVDVRMWVADDRIVVRVHDRGPGPPDPLVGLLCDSGVEADSGRGLWIVHNLDVDVALMAGDDGFTVRLAAGT